MEQIIQEPKTYKKVYMGILQYAMWVKADSWEEAQEEILKSIQEEIENGTAKRYVEFRSEEDI